MSDDVGTGTKAATRAHLRRARSLRDASQLQRAAEQLRRVVGSWWDDDGCGGAPGRIVASFASMATEPPVGALNTELHRRGATVVLPVCEPGFVLRWARWTPTTPMVRSGIVPIDHPAGPVRDLVDASDDVALLLVPALAVDTAGQRLGQGGGYYDRFLARWREQSRRAPLAAVVFDDEVLPAGSFDVLPHDQPVDLVITPAGVRDLRRP